MSNDIDKFEKIYSLCDFYGRVPAEFLANKLNVPTRDLRGNDGLIASAKKYIAKKYKRLLISSTNKQHSGYHLTTDFSVIDRINAEKNAKIKSEMEQVKFNNSFKKGLLKESINMNLWETLNNE